MDTTQKARLQVQLQGTRRDGDVSSFGMRGGLSDYHHQAGVGYHCCARAMVHGGQQLRSRAWRCPTPTPTAAADNGGEQHAAPAPGTLPGPLLFLQVRRGATPEKNWARSSL